MDELLKSVNEAFERLQRLKIEHEAFAKATRYASGERVGFGQEFTETYSKRLLDLEESLKEVARQVDRLKETQPAAEPFKPGDLVKEFSSLIEKSQVDIRQPQGNVAATVKSVDVEIKGLIVVQQNEVRIVTPSPGSTIDSRNLSTIRMSFGAVPNLRSPEGETEGSR